MLILKCIWKDREPKITDTTLIKKNKLRVVTPKKKKKKNKFLKGGGRKGN